MDQFGLEDNIVVGECLQKVGQLKDKTVSLIKMKSLVAYAHLKHYLVNYVFRCSNE